MYPYNMKARSNPNSEEIKKESTEIKSESVETESQEVTTQESVRPITNKYVLEMIEEAIEDEREDAEEYKKFAEKFQDKEDKDIIRNIYMDELKHEKMMKDIYYQLTGEKYQDNDSSTQSAEAAAYENMSGELSKRIMAELDGAEFYRKLYYTFLTLEIRDILFEIMTDELIHAQKLNYLYSKYK